MKKKIVLTLVAVSAAVYASFACSRDECGGGEDKCCTIGNVTYYTKASPPQS